MSLHAIEAVVGRWVSWSAHLSAGQLVCSVTLFLLTTYPASQCQLCFGPCSSPSLQVRAVSRRQFFTRSLGCKVAAAQKSAPPPQPQPVLPSSVPRSLSMGRAVVLPQGDRCADGGSAGRSGGKH